MKTLYLDCGMGAAGDMLIAALYELVSHDEKASFLEKMNSLGIPGVRIFAEKSVKCGISGTRINVELHLGNENGVPESVKEELSEDVDLACSDNACAASDAGGASDAWAASDAESDAHHHEFSNLESIEKFLSEIDLPDNVRSNAVKIFRIIADAESHIHGEPIDHIHFHEVGSMDAVADIVGVCMLIDMISPDRILASPIHVGSGNVHCSHGILPVPAPATAHILRNIPIYGGKIRGELCTPTGAALLKFFVSDFGAMPVMKISEIGYGMGKKNFEVSNCVRALLGADDEPVTPDEKDEQRSQGEVGQVVELRCNLDDMTPEAISFAQSRLFAAGALDVYTTPIGMKKCRPGVLFSCLCAAEKRDEMIKLIFKHTTTLGIREYVCRRFTLKRSEHLRKTKYGAVRVKRSSGFGVSREKIEYDDAARIAEDNDISLLDLSLHL